MLHLANTSAPTATGRVHDRPGAARVDSRCARKAMLAARAFAIGACQVLRRGVGWQAGAGPRTREYGGNGG